MITEKIKDLAYKCARKGYEMNEVPVGAVIYCGNSVIATAYNKKEKNNDISAHAEIIAIKKASKKLGTYILDNCELCITCEPCLMCAGAIMQSRIKKVYFATKNVKFGAILSKYNVFDDNSIGEKIEYECYYDDRCKNLLIDFFQKRR